MPEFILEFMKFMQHPDFLALGTVAGLAAFLKLIGVPAIKAAATKIGKPLTGTATVVAAFVASLIIAEAVGWYSHGLMSAAIAMEMVGVSVMATWTALGMQSTATAIVRSKES